MVQINLKDITPRPSPINTAGSHWYSESENFEVRETNNRSMISRGWVWGKWRDVGQRVPSYSYTDQ